MIHPEYLAALRRQYRAEMVLVLVQLEQLVPGWWESLQDLAERLGTDRATLNRSIRKLEDLGLLRRSSISNTGGTWIWWVKRHDADHPQPEDEPAWVLRNVRWRAAHERVTISQRWEWARRHQIPKGTMQSFLSGGQRVLRDRWELVATPHDRASDPATDSHRLQHR